MNGTTTSAQRHTARAGGVLLATILAAASASGDQILLIDSDVLTAYPLSTQTSYVQGVMPRLEQRGAAIDGSLHMPGVLG